MPGINENGEISNFHHIANPTAENHAVVDSFSRSTNADTRQIWQIALRDLHAQLDRHEYDSYFTNLALLELNQGTALIAAPSSHARRRLENQYEEVVSRALSDVVGQSLNVRFTVESPVQGQMFEPVVPVARLQNSYSQSTGIPNRPVPVPGIKARGPYLNIDQDGNIQNMPSQNRSSNNYLNGNSYGSAKNGYGSSSSGYGTRSRSQSSSPDISSLPSYNYGDERPELDEPSSPISSNLDITADYEAQSLKYGLNPRYIFDRYIVGSSNRMAAAAGRSVAENPGNSYNPLFIYGGVGLGKTHLLHAIGHEALRLRPYLRVLYVSSEKFTNDLVNSIREQRMEEFRSRYRSIDVLMIDDIQFIAGKEQTQEEFFHTFNTLVEANKQVVISSDRSPKSMLTLEDRLRSRFEGGLISDISLPDYEMRLAILQAKAVYQPVPISSDVLEFIAHKVPSNIRELEGALIRVVAFGFLNKMPITVDLAAQALNDSLLNSRKKLVTKERIVEAVANFYNVELKDLQGKSRSADIVLPRQVAMYILREQTDHSLVEIGQVLGGRDHTTVMHGLDKIEQAMDTNTQLRHQINTITQSVYNGEGLNR